MVLRTLSPSVVDPDGGLKLAVDGIAIDNAIVAGAYAGIEYNEHGLITAIDASGVIPSTDLPPATTTTIGAVSVPTTGGLSVSGAGELTHTNTVGRLTPGWFTTPTVISPALVPPGTLMGCSDCRDDG